MPNTDHATPANVDLPALTVGLDGHTRLAELRHLAALGGAATAFRRLEALAGYTQQQVRTAKYVGAHLHFITRPEIISILEAWAANSDYAPELLKLSACLGSRAEIIRTLRPVDEAERVSRALRGTIADEPLNALIAERRALVPDDALAHWIQQLRVFCLLRGLELLQVGSRKDRHLAEVCNATRKACEQDSSAQLKWIRLVASPSLHLADFEADLVHRCDMARARHLLEEGDPPSKSAQEFFRAVHRLAVGGAWWDPRSVQDKPTLPLIPIPEATPSTVGAPVSPPPERALDETAADVVTTPVADDHDSHFLSQSVKPGTTPFEIRKHGSEILLTGIEQHLHLATSWHQLST